MAASKQDQHPGKPEGMIALANVISDMGALVKLDASRNHMFGESDKTGITAWADVLKASTSITELNLAKNYINGADAKALAPAISSLTAALKRRTIEHQRPCTSIRLGYQDQHLLARTKDLRALMVATSNLNPSRCMPAISDDLLKEIAEWL
jgi:hypothetical protein